MADFLLKPREKLLQVGTSLLEDHELLAVILGRGTKKENVFALASRLLRKFDQQELFQIKTVAEFQQYFKVGFVHACQIMAVFELGKRFFQKNLPHITLRTADEAYELVKNLREHKREYVRGLYVNSRYQLIHDEVLTIGSLDSNIIHPREIFKPAIEYSAYGVILAHNHPSGDPTPSNDDIETTKRLVNVGELLQIPLLDHLVIGKSSYVSLNRYF